VWKLVSANNALLWPLVIQGFMTKLLKKYKDENRTKLTMFLMCNRLRAQSLFIPLG
jgi:hypothetical protein